MSALLWGNPLAWVGAAAVAVPILVHLLATRRARRVPFPTLRFLPAAPPTAMRARRIEDALLLALRCLIVLLAVAALARPWLALDGRAGDGEGDVPLAVVIDAGSSMRRVATGIVDDADPAAGDIAAVDGVVAGADPAPGGGPAVGASALESARAAADRLVENRTPATVMEADDLAAGLAAANAWLAAAGDRGGDREAVGEVVVLSDFQSGALAAGELAVLPAAIGIRLLQIGVAAGGEIELPAQSVAGRAWSVGAVVAPRTTGGAADEMAVSWLPLPPAEAAPAAGLLTAPQLLAGDGEAAGANAAAAAAARVVAVPREAATAGDDGSPGTTPGAGPPGAPRPVTVVWPGAPGRAELLAASTPPDRPWMANVLADLPQGAPVVARRDDDRLYLFAGEVPGSLTSAELLATLRRAAATADAVLAELEPGVIDAAVLRAWQRPPQASPSRRGSDGRWLWLAVLGLLLAEQGLRRGRPRGGSSINV